MNPEEEKDLQADLARFMQWHKIDSIQDVMAMEPAELLKMDGFGYRLLNYLIDLKKAN